MFKELIDYAKIIIDSVKNGFKKCGLCPIDRKKVLEMLPESSENRNEENDQELVDNAIIQYLKEERYSNASKKTTRKKRCSTAPGKSVCEVISKKSDEQENNENDDQIDDPEIISRHATKRKTKQKDMRKANQYNRQDNETNNFYEMIT